jgi:pimeloyl-ACP methyl ester carboxylesterase
MDANRFSAPAPGGALVGRQVGDGPPVLLLHGGPSLSYDYLDDLVAEFIPGYHVAWYQQRSLAPSTQNGPFTVEQHVADIGSVLDELGWERAWVVGHSWGGHLVIAAAVTLGERLLGAIAVDPLGSAGDGGAAEFVANMSARTPAESRERADQLDSRAMAGEGTAEDALEGLRLVWPAYFADPSSAPPMPPMSMSLEGYAETWASLESGLPTLTDALPTVFVPVSFVHGELSPIPITASTDTALLIPGASVEVVAGAGHFVWIERPGEVRRALDRLAAAQT